MSHSRISPRFIVLCAVCLAIALTAIQPRSAIAQDASANGVATVSGSMTITSPLFLKLSTERYVALLDMTAFVKRDLDMPPPYPDQPIAGVKGDLAKGATYSLPLPVEPRAV